MNHDLAELVSNTGTLMAEKPEFWDAKLGTLFFDYGTLPPAIVLGPSKDEVSETGPKMLMLAHFRNATPPQSQEDVKHVWKWVTDKGKLAECITRGERKEGERWFENKRTLRTRGYCAHGRDRPNSD